MSKSLTADDILPLIANLSVQERVRLIRLMVDQPLADAGMLYATIPPGWDEFSSDEEPLAWDADGWEDIG